MQRRNNKNLLFLRLVCILILNILRLYAANRQDMTCLLGINLPYSWVSRKVSLGQIK